MVNSYGQKPMEKPWIITHGDFMEFFCKGQVSDLFDKPRVFFLNIRRLSSPCQRQHNGSGRPGTVVDVPW